MQATPKMLTAQETGTGADNGRAVLTARREPAPAPRRHPPGLYLPERHSPGSFLWGESSQSPLRLWCSQLLCPSASSPGSVPWVPSCDLDGKSRSALKEHTP
ncbi:Folliculin-Interacting Protein 2 [Manis pentadactyla]|nr:Folliculin-Interacting Protein 2 [Manis pentadactyla]